MRVLLLCLLANLAQAQTPVAARADDKRLALNPVWTRIADINGEAGSIESVEFSPDGRTLISGSKFDNSIILWRTSDGTELWRRYLQLEIERVAFARDGSYVAVAGEDRQVRLLRATDGSEIKSIAHDNGIDALAFSYDGRYFATGEEYTGKGETRQGWVRLYAAPEATLVERVDLGETINNLDFSRDHQRLLAVGERGRAAVYSVPSLRPELRLEGDRDWHFIAGEISPDGRWIAIGDERGDIRVFDATNGETKALFNHSGSKIETIEFSADGQYLFSAGNDPFIRAWRMADILTGKRIYPALMLHAGDGMEYLDFSPNGALLASAHQDGAIRLWIVMGEDPDLNDRRHREVRAQQDKAFAP